MNAIIIRYIELFNKWNDPIIFAQKLGVFDFKRPGMFFRAHSAAPFDHRNCCTLYPGNVTGNSEGDSISFAKTNFHFLICALKLKSRSSVNVSACHPPASAIHAVLQIPAVPLKLMYAPLLFLPCCSTEKCVFKTTVWMRVKNNSHLCTST
jgi:hypothetical protein